MAQLAYVASCEWWRKSGGFTTPSLTTRHWNRGGENILIESSTALNSGQVVAKVVPLVVALDFLHSFHCMESMTKKVAKYWAHSILSFISILSNQTIISCHFSYFHLLYFSNSYQTILTRSWHHQPKEVQTEMNIFKKMKLPNKLWHKKIFEKKKKESSSTPIYWMSPLEYKEHVIQWWNFQNTNPIKIYFGVDVYFSCKLSFSWIKAANSIENAPLFFHTYFHSSTSCLF